MTRTLCFGACALTALLATLLSVPATPAHAAWPTALGDEVVITQPAGNKKLLRLFPDASGGVHLWYATDDPVTGLSTLRMNRLDASGDLAPGWPAEGRAIAFPARTIESDGAGGFYALGERKVSGIRRLSLTRLDAELQLAPGWSAPVDVLLIPSVQTAIHFPHLDADPGGVYVRWSPTDGSYNGTTTYLKRVSSDGSTPAGWLANGNLIASAENATTVPDGSGGLYVTWADDAVKVRHLTASNQPAPGWSTTPLVLGGPWSPGWPSGILAAADGAGGLLAFGDRLFKVGGDGTLAAGWPSEGIAIPSATHVTGILKLPDGSPTVVTWMSPLPWGAQATGVAYDSDDPSGPPAGWPAEGVALTAPCATFHAGWTRPDGLEVVQSECGPSSAIRVRRFAATSPQSPEVIELAEIGGYTEPLAARDVLEGVIVGWSVLSTCQCAESAEIRLVRMRADGALGAGAVAAVDPARASGLALAAPAPNPAHGLTVLAFDLPRAMRASVALFDLAGRRVRTLVDGQLPAGRSAPRWDGRDDAGRALPAGVYLALLSTDEGTRTRRVALLP